MKFDPSRWKELKEQERRLELEALNLYRPMPHQLAAHQSLATELMIRGGKRSGKSVAGAFEFASRILGIPLIGQDGQPLPLKHPVSTPESPRQYWIIGWDMSHSATIHRLLFQRGMGGTLRAIRDLETGKWRIYNRSKAEDVARFKESVLTEPLIPKRLLKEPEEDAFSWEMKKSYWFNSFELKNGTIVYYWPSSGKSPKQGEAVSGIWIDEDIQAPGHLKEWQDRLTDMNGWFMWTVWPHTKNNALIGLLDRAALAEVEDNPKIQSFQFVMTDNEFLTDEGKDAALGRMSTDDEIARRNRGDLLLDQLTMYDYSSRRHLLRRYEQGESCDSSKVINLLRRLITVRGRLPTEFCRYLAIDPSNTRTACLSFAVPPSTWDDVEMGNICIVEWELVVKKFSASMLAKELCGLMSGFGYEAFIMDQAIGRQTNTGRDEQVFDVYANAFRAQGLVSRQTLHSFIPGCIVPPVRYRAVRDALAENETGIPSLLFVEHTTWETRKEIANYRKSTQDVGGEQQILDQPANPRIFDCMAALEYGIAHILPLLNRGEAYQHPYTTSGRGGRLVQFVQDMLKQQQAAEQRDYVHFGPGEMVH